MATTNKSVARDLGLDSTKVDLKLPQRSPVKSGASKKGSTLYYGDNLSVLRDHIKDESVDLVYLDPPFNSSANYNVLFSTPKGHQSGAQIEAFEDTWHWGEQAERECSEISQQPNTDVTEVIRALRQFLGENDMMAYLVMMASRLIELHRVLKDTGSLYLHCDPTASHYLKILLDAVFGARNFRSEISWRRQSAHNDAKQGSKRYGNVRDVIFFYTKSDEWVWNWLYTPYDESYISDFYKHVEPKTGRLYQLSDLTGPGGAAKGNPFYSVMGVERYWRYSKEKMQALIAEGRVVQTKPGSVPRHKRYLDEMPGVALQNDWRDILPSSGQENLGYPTQKPLSLLERIVQASSNEGDVVLDPFCGCGTAVHASQKLKRKWIGIDVTHLAISIVERRLRGAFPGITFDVQGTPTDFEGAKDLAARDKYQFQWWACSLVNAQPYGGQKKGADGGIDGLIFFKDDVGFSKKIIVSVKGGENVGITMVKDLIATVAHQKAEIGLFITLAAPTRPMITEAASAGFYKGPTGATFPKIQILEIDKLLNGAQAARYPNLDAGALTFKKQKPEQGPDTQEYMFDAPPQKAKKKAQK
jgi:adenine specific DNA methylase Mod